MNINKSYNLIRDQSGNDNCKISLGEIESKIVFEILEVNKNIHSIMSNTKHYVKIVFVLFGSIMLDTNNKESVISCNDMLIYTTEYIKLISMEKSRILMITIKEQQKNIYVEHYPINEIKPMIDHTLMKFVPKLFYQILSPDKLYLLVGPQPIFMNIDYKHRGPQNFILTLVKVPNGRGAELHKHIYSTEIFFVVKGIFMIEICEDYNNLDSCETIELEMYDFIIIKKGIYRRFINIHEDEGIIMPIVLGTNDETKDIIFPSTTKSKILKDAGNMDKILLNIGERIGLNFDKNKNINNMDEQ